MFKSGRRDSDPRHPAWETNVRPSAEKPSNPLGTNGFGAILPRFPTFAIRLKQSHFVAIWCGSRGEKW